MSVAQAIFLGFIQGFSEFLPISSSGHLVLLQHWLGIKQANLFFETMLHAGTLGSILFFFKTDLINLKKKTLIDLSLATVPIVLVSLLASSLINLVSQQPLIVANLLLLTAGFNFLTDFLFKKNQPKNSQKPSGQQTLIMGLFQAGAVFPGISRSATTFLGAALAKLAPKQAFKFSFLLAIPALIGALIYQSWQVTNCDLNLTLLVGVISAFSAGLLALKILQKLFIQQRLKIFGWYCLIVGLVSLITFL